MRILTAPTVEPCSTETKRHPFGFNYSPIESKIKKNKAGLSRPSDDFASFHLQYKDAQCGVASFQITWPISAAGTQINMNTHCRLCWLWLKSSSGWIAPCCCKHWCYFETLSWQIGYNILVTCTWKKKRRRWREKSCSFSCEILERSDSISATQGDYKQTGYASFCVTVSLVIG